MTAPTLRVIAALSLAVAAAVTACRATESGPSVTLVEIGSANCEPCTRMEGVMKEIEERYKGSVRVEFQDAHSNAGMIYVRRYGLRVVPTQLFIDRNGLELLRHEGAVTREELLALLTRAGVK